MVGILFLFLRFLIPDSLRLNQLYLSVRYTYGWAREGGIKHAESFLFFYE